MPKKLYIFANWKMYLDYNESVALAKDLSAFYALRKNKNIEMCVFPSALALDAVKNILTPVGILYGPQNVYWIDKGGYTGETSATACKQLGCTYVLVGHSERRHLFGETNHEVRQKIEAVLEADLTPVLCVGETKSELEAGNTKEVLEIQLRGAYEGLSYPKDKKIIIAYEPVWAISARGAGLVCDPIVAASRAAEIKQIVSTLLGVGAGANFLEPIVLYGGSVRPQNIIEFISQENISGVLVGGASAKMDSWGEMLELVVS